MWSTGRFFFYAGFLLGGFGERIAHLLIHHIQLSGIVLIGNDIGKSVIVAVPLGDAVQHAKLFCQLAKLWNILGFDLQHFGGNAVALESV